MAKFWLEDGSVKSGDRIMYEINQQHKEDLYEMDRMRDKLNQICMYDLLVKIQDGINQDKCIVETLKNEQIKHCDHNCKICIMRYLNEKR